MSPENRETSHDTDDQDRLKESLPVQGMYENWFLDYASYVILERAVPALADGLKPVQRRILHAMRQMHDGRYHKVANIIGQTMQYHPHGDAAIGDAIVNLGQKELLIDTQGNWGDIRTGDPAAAARYIEARLTPFALQVVFNPKTTEWQLSYDGRKKEPVHLPVKFPLVLAQGVEGIAVGLSTRILPHNFIELVRGSIAVLKGKKTQLLPDFPTGGMIDVSDYQRGKRGGRIRIRAHIEVAGKNQLIIRDVPYGTTTSSLIDSIIKANEKGKLKIKRVVDNTAQDVEIIVDLPAGVSPDKTVDALYAFTDCEVSISPNACVIVDDKPRFLEVDEILRISTNNTVQLLKRELEIRQEELKEKWHAASLERIFIENRIYRDIEECETWESVLETIDHGLEPFKPTLHREVTEEDIIRLTEIKIKRISRYDLDKARNDILKLEEELKEVAYHLAHLTEYAIAYFEELLEKYGKGRERKTEIREFDKIQVTRVAANNVKLYVNRAEGFIGFGLKKEEFVCECSDLDDIIVFRSDGHFAVTRISDKTFVGKGIIHVQVWEKGNDRMVYHMIYSDPASGRNYAKRFNVTSVTRDKEYNLAGGSQQAKVVYFAAHPNSESETVQIYLSPSCRARIKDFEFDFGSLAIKGRGAKGNIVTKYPIRKVVQKELGASTLGGRKIWYDPVTGRLNTEERGTLLGEFDTGDEILAIYKDGSYELRDHSLDNRFDIDKTLLVTLFRPEQVISAVYYDGERKAYFVKRFQVETRTHGQRFRFIPSGNRNKLVVCSLRDNPVISFRRKFKKKDPENLTLSLAEFIDVKGWKAVGNKLGGPEISGITLQDEPEASLPGKPTSPGKKPSGSSGMEKPPKVPVKTSGNGTGNSKKPVPEVKVKVTKPEAVTPGTTIEWNLEKDDETVREDTPEEPIQGELFD